METRLTLDCGEGVIVAETVQDVEPILERNKALRSIEQKSDWGRHIASIPKRGNVGLRIFSKEFDALIAKKLNDPDWKFLRVDR